MISRVQPCAGRLDGQLQEGLTLGEKLRILRKKMGLTQQEISDLLRLDRSTYTYYECDTTKPRLETLQQIAHLFGVPVDSLLADVRPPQATHSELADEFWAKMRDMPRPKPPEEPVALLPVAPSERQLLRLFRAASSETQEKVIHYLWRQYAHRTLHEADTPEKKPGNSKKGHNP